MWTRSFKIALVIGMLVLLTGCWSRRELTEHSIASAFGFDKSGDRYQVAVQLLNTDEIATNKGGSGQRMPIITQQLAGGKTIFESTGFRPLSE